MTVVCIDCGFVTNLRLFTCASCGSLFCFDCLSEGMCCKCFVSKYDCHVREVLGDFVLSDLTTEVIEEKVNLIPYGRTREKTFTILKACLKWAVLKKRIAINPCDGVEVADFKEETRLPMNDSQFKKFKKALVTYPTGLQFRVYAETGMRKEEIKTIELFFSKVKPYLKINGTKSDAAVRECPVTVELAVMLKEFFDGGGKFSIHGTSKRMKRICKNAEIDYFSVHCLRHTFATRCYYEGIPIERISYWLGHESIGITERYINKLVGLQKGDNKLIDKVFARK